jgi:ABC-type multidrug transport system ATPase subunit
MDEPSTGLDPASRSNLWNVVKRAKQDRAIILTSTTLSLIILEKGDFTSCSLSHNA